MPTKYFCPHCRWQMDFDQLNPDDPYCPRCSAKIDPKSVGAARHNKAFEATYPLGCMGLLASVVLCIFIADQTERIFHIGAGWLLLPLVIAAYVYGYFKLVNRIANSKEPPPKTTKIFPM